MAARGALSESQHARFRVAIVTAQSDRCVGRGEAGGDSGFRPEFLTRTAVEGFLSPMQAGGYGASHRAGTKNAISGYCVRLVEEHGAPLRR